MVSTKPSRGHHANRDANRDTNRDTNRAPRLAPVQASNPQLQAPICHICSTDEGPSHHSHFSSKYGRILVGMGKPIPAPQAYLCPTCKRIHRADTQSRVKLVLSTSTLHMWFDPPTSYYGGDKIHTNYSTIPGVSIG